jgi:hypothetical protein
MSVPKEVISKVAQETGVPERTVSDIAERFGEAITRTAKLRVGCTWAKLRCITCIGIVRKVFWCLVAGLCG